MQTVCYPLIHAKLRQFLRKLAGGPGWIRIPLLGSSPARDFSSNPILHQLLQQMLIYRAVVESVARDSASQALNKRPIIVKPSVRIRRWIFTESMRARPKDIEREVRFRPVIPARFRTALCIWTLGLIVVHKTMRGARNALLSLDPVRPVSFGRPGPGLGQLVDVRGAVYV